MIFKAFTYVKKAFANKGLNGTIEVVGDFKNPTKAIINILNQFFKIYFHVFLSILVVFAFYLCIVYIFYFSFSYFSTSSEFKKSVAFATTWEKLYFSFILFQLVN